MELNEFGMIARKMWLDITKVYPNYESKAFQVMPNHLHGILSCNSNTNQIQISEVVGSYKSLVTNESLKIFKARGITMGKFWQRGFHEHIIRSERAYNNINNYILCNPRNWKGEDIKIDIELLRRIEAM